MTEYILITKIEGQETTRAILDKIKIVPFKKLDWAAKIKGLWLLIFLNFLVDKDVCFFNFNMEFEERNV